MTGDSDSDRRPALDIGQQLSRGTNFTSETVEMDGRRFEFCTFVDCTLVYRGGAPFSLTGCTHVGGTRYQFLEGARRTLHIMTNMMRDPIMMMSLREMMDELQHPPDQSIQ